MCDWRSATLWRNGWERCARIENLKTNRRLTVIKRTWERERERASDAFPQSFYIPIDFEGFLVLDAISSWREPSTYSRGEDSAFLCFNDSMGERLSAETPSRRFVVFKTLPAVFECARAPPRSYQVMVLCVILRFKKVQTDFMLGVHATIEPALPVCNLAVW